MKHLIFTLLFLLSCTVPNYMPKAVNKTQASQKKIANLKISSDRIPLEQRGWSKDLRKGYIKDLGPGFYDKDVADAFINGRVYYQMERSLVENLYKYPNINIGDSVWIYEDEDSKELLRIEFKNKEMVGIVVNDFTYNW